MGFALAKGQKPKQTLKQNQKTQTHRKLEREVRNMVFNKCSISFWDIQDWSGAVRVNSNESISTGFGICMKKRSYIW